MRATILLMAMWLGLAASAQRADPEAAARKATSRRIDTLARRALTGGKRGARALADLVRELEKAPKSHGAVFASELRQSLEQRARKQRATALADIEKTIVVDDKLRKRLRAELFKRRRYALGFIYSKSAYRKGRARAQQEVDRRVAQVRQVWQDPFRAMGDLQRRIGKMFDRFDAGGELLARLGLRATESATRFAALRKKLNGELDVRSFGYDEADDERIAEGARILKANAADTAGTKAERELVRLTNQYRVMMGLVPLRINARLMSCARGHSEHMKKTRRFSHVDRAHPQGATPVLRAQRAGYGDLVGENILMGMDSPAKALEGWLRSAGHHRNIVSAEYHSLGVGQAGSFWTQVFGHS